MISSWQWEQTGLGLEMLRYKCISDSLERGVQMKGAVVDWITAAVALSLEIIHLICIIPSCFLPFPRPVSSAYFGCSSNIVNLFFPSLSFHCLEPLGYRNRSSSSSESVSNWSETWEWRIAGLGPISPPLYRVLCMPKAWLYFIRLIAIIASG